MKKYFKILTILVVLPLLLRCSNTNLTHPQVSNITLNNTITGTLCSQSPSSTSTPMNIIFIIDMSFSNIGKINNSGVFDQSVATDSQALRIQKSIDYINSCGSAAGTKFAVMGFADNIINNDSSNSRCTAFTDKTQALKDLQQLKNQQSDAVTSPVGVMKSTYYSAAFDCLDTLMKSEISNSDPTALKNQLYTALFLTDGAPSTQGGDPIPTTQASDFSNKVKATSVYSREATGGFILQSVYYGNVDFPTAKLFLDPIAQAGGSSGVLKLDDLSAVDFCTVAHAPMRVPFTLTQFAAVNLTAKMKNGALLPDSDGDGVPDNIDAAPTNRRSTNKILDSICQLVGPSCADYSNQGCNPNWIDSIMGLSDCDQAIMGLSKIGDQDRDGIPDAIEILKGTLPLTFDSDHQDGDGLTVLEKIKRGRQPYFKEGNIPANLEMKSQFAPSQTGACGPGIGEWSFSVTNDPLVQTLAYQSTDPNEQQFMGHAAGENVIVVYFYSQPVNSTAIGTQIYVSRTLRLKFGQTAALRLFPTDFKLLAEVPTP